LDFGLSRIQELVKKNVRRFAEEVLVPIAPELDRQSKKLPQEIIDLMAKQKLFGIQIAEKYEGAGLDSISYVAAIEEISKACGATGLMTTVHNSVVAAPLEKFGNEDQKMNYLCDLASGRKIGAFSITEPNAGSDAMGLLTTAERDGNDWILNGQKCFVTNGGLAETFLIGAVHDRQAKAKGIGVFIVDKKMPGFKVGKIEEKLGVRSNPVSELFLDNVRIPAENVLGKLQDGFKIMMQTLDMGRIGIGTQGLGIAQAAYEAAAKYANERRQFGKPIGEFQAISFKLAEMRSALDASRYLIYRAAWLKDQHLPYSMESAMAKMYATDSAMRVCTDAIQIFGGYGFIQDLPTERYFRDVKITQIYEGTNEIMKIIIGNAILKEFAPAGF
jgi:butyryl-CoA dehydrogenase